MRTKGGLYRTLSLSQGDQFRDTDHQRQKLQSSNKKWHLPPVFSTLLFWNSKYQKEKVQRCVSLRINGLSPFDIWFSCVFCVCVKWKCTYTHKTIRLWWVTWWGNQFTGSKSSGCSLIWLGFDILFDAVFDLCVLSSSRKKIYRKFWNIEKPPTVKNDRTLQNKGSKTWKKRSPC